MDNAADVIRDWDIHQHRLIPKRMINSVWEGCDVKCSVCNKLFDACEQNMYFVYHSGFFFSSTKKQRMFYATTCSQDCATFYVMRSL